MEAGTERGMGDKKQREGEMDSRREEREKGFGEQPVEEGARW